MSRKVREAEMNEAHIQYLRESFPNTLTTWCGDTRIACGDGWFELVADLVRRLADIKNLHLLEIKEKFGSLYVLWYSQGVISKRDTTRVNTVVATAEEKSATICEWCGARAVSGRLPTGAVKTLCLDCLTKVTSEGIRLS